MGLDVNAIREKRQPFPYFPNVLVTLEIDKNVTPKQSPYFRIPAPIMEEVEAELQKLLELDIIESAVEIFQKEMTKMLSGREGAIMYLDDVAVAGSEQNHDVRLKKVLDTLKENNASLNLIEQPKV